MLRIQNKKSEYHGSIRFLHASKDNFSSAFETSEKISIEAILPRIIAPDSIVFNLYQDGSDVLRLSVTGEWIDLNKDTEIYKFEIPKGSLMPGLYFGRLVLESDLGSLYSRGSYDSLSFSFEPGLPSVQLTVAEFEYSACDAITNGIIYHIFVDRFNRGGKSESHGDSIICNGEWDYIPEFPEYPGAPLKNNTFYGGTLWGIIDKLDYISSLGASTIYLSPIFESPSNHRYDTADYTRVDSLLGGDEALKALIQEADRRGIKIILDGVFNHTGADSVYFNNKGTYKTVGAYQSKESPYYKWYDFKDYPNKYTCWWDIEILPRINPDEPSCSDFFIGNDGVIKKYRDMGILGLRLDVADELSDNFISSIKSVLSKNGESMLYGEVWEDASNKIAYNQRKKYYLGKELDGVMNYPLRKGIIDYIVNRRTDSLRYALCEVMLNAPKRITDRQMNLLGTHDTERILTILGGAPMKGESNVAQRVARLTDEQLSVAKMRLCAAYTVLSTLPGIPTVYYGDEAGLEGYKDPFNRMPYPWRREDADLLLHYRKIGKLRQNNRTFVEGSFKLHLLTDDMLIFSRKKGKSVFLTVYNKSKSNIIVESDDVFSAVLSGLVNRKHSVLNETAEVFKIKDHLNYRITKE